MEVDISLSDYNDKIFIREKVWWCWGRVPSSAIYLEGYGRGGNSPVKITTEAQEAGIGNLMFSGGPPGSQRMKECGSIPCEEGEACVYVSQSKRQKARHYLLCLRGGAGGPDPLIKFPGSTPLNSSRLPS